MSIISTRSNNQSSSTPITSTTNINSGASIDVETYDGSNNPMIRWSVTIIETVTLQTYAFEISAIHDFSNNVSFNKTNIIGNNMNLNIISSSGAGNIINLSITNNEANTIRVFSKKI